MFDTSKFENAKLEHRTESVDVPELKAFFSEEAEPKFSIRGLSGEELALVREAAAKNRAAREGLLAAQSSGSLTDEVRAAILTLVGGNSATVPDEHARFLELVRLGMVSPKLEHSQIVRLAQYYPITFLNLAHKITALSNMGASEKKPVGSTQSRE